MIERVREDELEPEGEEPAAEPEAPPVFDQETEVEGDEWCIEIRHHRPTQRTWCFLRRKGEEEVEAMIPVDVLVRALKANGFRVTKRRA
jgi:hypothetical protein